MPTFEFSTEELQKEEWRTVVGYFSGLYSISNLGRVRRDRAAKGATSGHILKPHKGTDGYWYVRLSLSCQQRGYSIQRLVCDAFLGPKPKGHNINHIDGVKTNNRLWNLEYVTYSRNSKHAFEIGLSPRGENHGISKLTNAQVKEIKKELAQGIQGNQTTIAKRYGVNDTVISKIKRGEIWTHITLD